MRDYQKLVTLQDFEVLDAPMQLNEHAPRSFPDSNQMILRMLVRPKYGPFAIPDCLTWLAQSIAFMRCHDAAISDITQSWCYVTVRHGPVVSKNDDEWHFDGASFRVESIPDRNYIWSDHSPTEFKTGTVKFPDDFDPLRHNIFPFVAEQVKNEPVQTVEANKWHMLNAFCLHRRPQMESTEMRTFIRISFTETEIRDTNNTPNPLLVTPSYGRDPVKLFRNKLITYP